MRKSSLAAIAVFAVLPAAVLAEAVVGAAEATTPPAAVASAAHARVPDTGNSGQMCRLLITSLDWTIIYRDGQVPCSSAPTEDSAARNLGPSLCVYYMGVDSRGFQDPCPPLVLGG
jgi:hypothetical protein